MAPRILQYSDLETALDDPTQCGALVGAITARRDENTIVLGTGDNTAPSALSLATEGGCALPFFRAIGPDCDVFGNHDFDFGPERARKLAERAPQQWLCANAWRDGKRFAADATVPTNVIDLADSRVGVIGLAHPKTDTINPATADIEFENPIPVVQKHATALREQGVDYVVVASHCGRLDREIARETNVEAVCGGHVHDVFAEIIKGTAVVRPGRAGERFSEIVLEETPEIKIHDVTDTVVDEDVTSRLESLLAEHGLQEVVATVENPIERTEEAATVAESKIGNLVTDALRWKGEADIALCPPGAIRAGRPLLGEVTVADLITLTPYEDNLAVVELSGERLWDAFVAVPFGYHDDGYPDRFSSHVSGATVVWDDAAGELIDARVGGEPIDPDGQYTIAVADYLVYTDHVNSVFDEADVINRAGVAYDAIVDYVRKVGLHPRLEGRVKRPALDTTTSETETDI